MTKSTITISEDNSAIKTSEDFLKWFLNDKPYESEIIFKGNSKEIGKMDALYEFIKYHQKTKNICEKEMDSYNDIIQLEDNKFIQEAVENFVTSNRGGKFLRATLCALGYQSFEKEDSKYIPLSIALELFQTSILIHDDIIDEATVRRGLDTIPVKYKKIYRDPIKKGREYEKKLNNLSDSMALCLGDMGLYLANQVIVKNYKDEKTLSKILEYFNEIAIKTCKGEMLDVVLPFYEEFYGQEDLEPLVTEIYKLKTSWYSVIGPYALGAILAGLEEEKINKLEDALMNLGIAFQIKDDLLGIYGDEKKIGKSVISDCEEFKQTVLYAYTVNTNYKEELLKYYGKKNITEKELSTVKEIFKNSGAKEYSEKLMDKLFKESFDEILSLDFLPVKYKKILLGFAEFLKVRNK